MCASDNLPGPAVIITRAPASNIRSNAYPPFPVKFAACFTRKIAPNIMIEINDAEILVKTPMINKIPEINSASAIGICISGGSPICSSMVTKPGPNFPEP